MKTAAFCSAISKKLDMAELYVIDKLELAEGKTRLMAAVCNSLDAGKKALFVLGSENENVVRATRNLYQADVISADVLSVYDLVRANNVYLTVEAVEKINSLKNVEEVE